MLCTYLEQFIYTNSHPPSPDELIVADYRNIRTMCVHAVTTLTPVEKAGRRRLVVVVRVVSVSYIPIDAPARGRVETGTCRADGTTRMPGDFEGEVRVWETGYIVGGWV